VRHAGLVVLKYPCQQVTLPLQCGLKKLQSALPRMQDTLLYSATQDVRSMLTPGLARHACTPLRPRSALWGTELSRTGRSDLKFLDTYRFRGKTLGARGALSLGHALKLDFDFRHASAGGILPCYWYGMELLPAGQGCNTEGVDVSTHPLLLPLA
jgi:hypothetical protein